MHTHTHAHTTNRTDVVQLGLGVPDVGNSVSYEAKNGADPQQHSEATEELFEELDPLWGCLGRRQNVRTLPGTRK